MTNERLTPGQLLHFHRMRSEAAEKSITSKLDEADTIKWKVISHEQRMLFIEQIYGGMDASIIAAMFRNYAESIQQKELELNA